MSDSPPIPKSRRLFVKLLACAFAFLIFKEFFDNLEHVLLGGCDPGWLIKTGQFILTNRTLPRADIFSWTATQNSLVCYQWLFEALQAYLYNAAGLWLVGLVSLLTAGLLYLFILPVTWLKSGVRPVWILSTLALIFSPYWIMARPQTISHVFIFAFIWFLERYISTRRVLYLLVLPPLAILWNNLHLTAVIGILILLAYLLDAVISTYLTQKPNLPLEKSEYLSPAEPDARTCLWLTIAALVVIACLLINPYGIDLLLYQVTYPTRMSAADIAELKGLNIIDALFRLIHLAIVWIALVAIIVRRGLPIRWLILAAVGTFAFFVVTRLQPLVVLFTWLPVGAALASFEIPGYIERGGPATGFQQATKSKQSLIAATLAVASLAIPAIMWYSKYPRESEIRTAFLGEKSLTLRYYAIHCAKYAHPFNDSDTGDRLIFLDAGPVFIDSRFDFYGREFFRNWFDTVEAYGNWQKRLNRYNPTHLLVKDTHKLYWKLMTSNDWSHVVDDGYLSLWMPNNDSTARWLTGEQLDDGQLKTAGLEPQLLAATVTGRACKHLQMGKNLLEQNKVADAVSEISQAYNLIPSDKLAHELSDARARLQSKRLQSK